MSAGVHVLSLKKHLEFEDTWGVDGEQMIVLTVVLGISFSKVLSFNQRPLSFSSPCLQCPQTGIS